MGATLILLNGPPASGKSTLAQRLVDLRPLALDLDIDVVRGQLGDWSQQPTEAGVAARALAIAMIDTHLESGRDVVVPQLLARVDFIEQLERAAQRADARFVEIALDISRSDAADSSAARRARPTHPTHRDAAELVDQSTSPDPLGDLYDALQELLAVRPMCHRVAVVRGDVDASLLAIRRVLHEHGIDW